MVSRTLYVVRVLTTCALAGWLAARLGIGDIAVPIKVLSKWVELVGRGVIYVAFTMGFLLQWFSLHLCLLAVGVISKIVSEKHWADSLHQ